jgi:hypothetical protein
MLDGLNIYSLINFFGLVIAIFVGWKKLSPKDWTGRISEMGQHIEDLEKSIDRIEKSVEKIRDLLIEGKNK